MLIKKQNKNGFSLIELLVVISIIGILSTILVTNFMGMREKAKDAQKIQDLNSMKNALRSYYNDNQSYPVDVSEIKEEYFPALDNIGFVYKYVVSPDGETFSIETSLDSGAGDDDIDSQKKCGIVAPLEKNYVVCAN